MLLVPNNISSVERYFHFLMGYFVPAVAWLDRTGTRRVTVRDCGPLNPWFDLLRPSIDVEIIPAGQMLKRYVSRSQPRVVLPQYDNPLLFRRSTLRRVSMIMRAMVGQHPDPSSIVVLRRGSSHPYYGTAGSEVPIAGAGIRSLANVDEIAEAVASQLPVTILEAETTDPAAQIRAFGSARVLIGQHGAGLANMIWMRPDGVVVEIQPPLRDDVRDLFPDLAETMGLRFQLVGQDSLHGPASPEAVRAAVEWARAETVEARFAGAPLREARRVGKSLELRLQRWPVVGPLTHTARRLTGP